MASESDFSNAYASALDAEFELGNLQSGALNDLLREQLTPLSKEEVGLTTIENTEEEQASNTQTSVTQAAIQTMDLLLRPDKPERCDVKEKLSILYHLQKDLFESLNLDEELTDRQYIARTGLIMSPRNCLTTVMDDLRMGTFGKAVYQAITEKLQANKVITIAYPACGPFAPLLLPLLCWLKNNESIGEGAIQISLIDAQEGAIRSLQRLVEEMQLSAWINGFYCMDAMDFNTDVPFDIVLLEALQHGFTREGHLAIAQHFAQQLAEDGEFLPNEIVLNAVINSPQKEFVEQWQGADEVAASMMNKEIVAGRVNLGEIGRINANHLRELKVRRLPGGTQLVEFNSLKIPEIEMVLEPALLICTRVKVREGIWLDEYDSGITHPLPDQHVCVNFKPREERTGDLLVESGDYLKFYYRWIGLPGFLVTHENKGLVEC